jgi:malonyl-CoA/methylmalonyl-CoA synthetase
MDLAALADKYEALATLRGRRDEGGAGATRDQLRRLARAFPGALRELDTLGAAELGRRARACRAAAAGGPEEPWMRWIWLFHRLLAAALAVKREAGVRARTTQPLPPARLRALAEAALVESGISVDDAAVAAWAAPPGGRLVPLVLRTLARETGIGAAALSATLFPPRRPPPYTLEEMDLPRVTLLDRLADHAAPEDVAVRQDAPGGGVRETRYRDLLARAHAIAALLRDGRPSLDGAPVAFLLPASAAYVEALLGVWLAGGLAIPLSPLHTTAELAYVLDHARPLAVLSDETLAARVPPLSSGARLLELEEVARAGTDPGEAPAGRPAPGTPALMLFTSGTTGRPKGVVSSHAAVAATLGALEGAWGWRRDDRLLHVLPLHHTHGVVVALMGALWAGATVRFAPFDARRVWGLLQEATVFMGVPTVYTKLLEAYRAASELEQARWRDDAQRLRLFTSGSAALAPSVFEAFAAITGQALLERYGMTEIGMALSNPLVGPRLPGAVGRELPGVQVDLVDDDGRLCPPGAPGELRVRSPQMFSGYFGDPAATAAAFDEVGRFRTGDTGIRDDAGVVRLLGRTSVDVLKSGGYKLSALEIEEALRAHPAIAEVAVVGLPDETWGDRVTACAVLHPGAALTLDALRAWAKDRLAPYKIPRQLELLDALPRNAMGKLQKTELKRKLTKAP